MAQTKVSEPSSYLRVHGHEELRRRLLRAIERGRFPQALLLHGPRGIGKQRLALWAAAALQCRETAPPCGRCLSCRLAGRLEHPDIHWFFPLPRPRGTAGPEKLEAALEEARRTVLDERRTDSTYLEDRESPTGIYVGSARVIRRLAQHAPAMGPRKLIVIGRAEALIPQRGSEQSANALLKVLEEPPQDTHVVLTCDVRGALLPTIRSRVQSIHVNPLSAGEVADFLIERRGLSARDAEIRARRSGGSIGRALEFLDEESGHVREQAVELVRAILDGRPVARYFVAHGQGVSARGRFSGCLDEARALIRDLLAARADAPAAASDPGSAAELLARYSPDSGQLLGALDALEEARELAERNINPQLITAELARKAGAHAQHSSGRAAERRPKS